MRRWLYWSKSNLPSLNCVEKSVRDRPIVQFGIEWNLKDVYEGLCIQTTEIFSAYSDKFLHALDHGNEDLLDQTRDYVTCGLSVRETD
jgi:hypothetical protein